MRRWASYSREQGVTRLFATGELAKHAVAAFGIGAQWFPDIETLSSAVGGELARDVVVLVKASRAMRFEHDGPGADLVCIGAAAAGERELNRVAIPH